MKKIMLIGIGWEQIPLLEKAKEMNLRTIVTTMWDKSKLNADVIYEVDSRDVAKLEEIFLQEKPDAVLADECDYSMYAVAYLTEKYNLPGPGLYALTVTNNKFLQRELASSAGIKQPKYEMCWNLDMALIAANKIGFPVVVKPLDNRGSIGVFTVQDEADLKKYWYISVANSHSRMCIVEEFIEGDIVTYEGFHDSKKFNFLSVATKESYEETGNVAKALYYPGKINNKIYENLIEQGYNIAKSVGINYGFVHIEFMICKTTKEPYFIEIANRGGGVHISNIILPHITGIDLVRHSIDLALGRYIDIYWNGEYLSKVLMYFLNPAGTKSADEIINTYEDKLLAMYIKKKNPSVNVTNKGALGRVGVAIINGLEFENLRDIGSKLEKGLIVVDDEFIWIA